MNDTSVYDCLLLWNFNGSNVTGGRWEDRLTVILSVWFVQRLRSRGQILTTSKKQIVNDSYTSDCSPGGVAVDWFILQRYFISTLGSNFAPLQDANILTTVEQIAVKFCRDIYGPQRMNPTDSLWSSGSTGMFIFVIHWDTPLGLFDGIQCFFPREHLSSESESGLLQSRFLHYITYNLPWFGHWKIKHSKSLSRIILI